MRGWRRVAPLLVFLLHARAEAQPVADGHPEIGGVLTASEQERGTVRASWRASYFQADDFGKSGVDLTGLGSSLAIGWSPLERLSLALQGSGTSHQGDGMVPGAVQALGDVAVSAEWVPIGSKDFRAGARAGVLLLSGDKPFAYGAAASPFVDLLASSTLGPLSLHANAGFLLDRSEEAIPAETVLSPPLRAAYGVSEGPSARASVAAAFPLLSGRLEPFAAVKSRLWFGDVESGDTVLGAGGVRVALGPADRRLSIEAGVDLALVPGKDTATRPLEPPARVYATLSFVLPPARPQAVVTRVEVPMPPATPTTGDVEGLVRDGRSGEPLAWVIVDVPGVTQNPILTDASGVYRVKSIPAGAIKVRVQKQGYALTTLPVDIKAGAVSTADVTLEPAGAKTTGVFAGDVRGRDGKPVLAKATFQLASETRTVVADATGKFQVTLPPGTFQLKVEAAGFISQTRPIVVTAGEQTAFNFVLQPVQQ